MASRDCRSTGSSSPQHAAGSGDLLKNLVLGERANHVASAGTCKFGGVPVQRFVMAVARAAPFREASAAVFQAADGVRAQGGIHRLVEREAGGSRGRTAIEEALRPWLTLVRDLVAGTDIARRRYAEIVVSHAAEAVGDGGEASGGEAQQPERFFGRAPGYPVRFDENLRFRIHRIPPPPHTVERLDLNASRAES